MNGTPRKPPPHAWPCLAVVATAAGLLGCAPIDDPGDPAVTAVSKPLSCAPLVAQLDSGMGHPCVVKTDGTLWCWGRNYYGQVGDGTTVDRTSPVQVTALGNAVSKVAGGETHGCAIKTDGSLWCWGRNADGQLGDGTTTDRLSPVRVTSLGTGVVEVSLGIAHTCARKTDGTLWCWGYNNYGAIGDGTSTTRRSPVQVTSLSTSVAQVSAGEYHTCARRTDGNLYCWGDGVGGQLGNGSGQHRYTPTRVSTLGASVAQVASGSAHTCALKTDGTMWCWGYNIYGALGIGTTEGTLAPVRVTAIGSSVREISVGSGAFSSCARQPDNSLWCWGGNNGGQLGDGTTTNRLLPVRVSGMGTNVARIAQGGGVTCALGLDDTVWCWGANGRGQLGDGTKVDRSTPGRVPLPACTDPPVGQSCGSCGGTVLADGSCSVATPANLGTSCGSCGGTVRCDGTCSVATPGNFGASCGSCGGTVRCDGSCSVATPGNFGASCGSCGGTVRCDGTCSVVTPPNFGAPCGCGGSVRCDGTCSAASCSPIRPGTWVGTTGQSLPIVFDVDTTGTSVTHLKTSWAAPACGMTGSVEFFVPEPIVNSSFVKRSSGTCPALEVVGTFDSATTATGTAKLTFSGSTCGCVGTATVPWSAAAP